MGFLWQQIWSNRRSECARSIPLQQPALTKTHFHGPHPVLHETVTVGQPKHRKSPNCPRFEAVDPTKARKAGKGPVAFLQVFDISAHSSDTSYALDSQYVWQRRKITVSPGNHIQVTRLRRCGLNTNDDFVWSWRSDIRNIDKFYNVGRVAVSGELKRNSPPTKPPPAAVIAGAGNRPPSATRSGSIPDREQKATLSGEPTVLTN